jgi:glycosyltransferase involved in cell wall biosynthesis
MWAKDRWRKYPPLGIGHLERLLFARRLHVILQHHRPAIVHYNLYRHTTYLDLCVARRSGTVVISHVRSLASQALLSRKVLANSDGIICTSDIVRREVELVYPEGFIRSIYDGVNCDRYRYHGTREEAKQSLNLRSDAFILSSVAMLDPRKGHDVAIRAMPKIVKHNPSVILIIAGGEPDTSQGKETRRLRALAETNGIGAYVRFLGHCSDMAALYTATDVVLALSSDGEAFGRVPVEAACAQRPVIATGLGATPEIVEPDFSGILVARRDSGAVADAVMRLCAQPETATRLGRQAGEKVAALFNSRVHADKVQAFYEELLQKHQRPPGSRS